MTKSRQHRSQEKLRGSEDVGQSDINVRLPLLSRATKGVPAAEVSAGPGPIWLRYLDIRPGGRN